MLNLKRNEGQGVVEYALMLLIVSILTILGLQTLGEVKNHLVLPILVLLLISIVLAVFVSALRQVVKK